ncbi:hypothetical protein P4K96_29095 [Bacillus cereus]|uniref:hypothetical protein n=1 Tax=Paenibacillus melissococcoides TaxID=2912268 RepID=UPI002DCF6D50|nr:hypothetical protein [Bacillus cereus]
MNKGTYANCVMPQNQGEDPRRKYRETPPLKKGDFVVMHTCVEAQIPMCYGKIWRCKTDQFSRGKGVYEQHSVFLDGFTGSFAVEYLQKVNLDELVLWEEVERLKEENEQFRLHQEVQQSWAFHMIEGQIKMGEEIERLQGQLQDALKVMQEAIDDIDCEYPQTARIALDKAIQRIQEGTGHGDR